MTRRRDAKYGIPFLDVIFNLLLGITAMFFLAFILIKPEVDGKKVDLDAEFIVTLEWNKNLNTDIDLWVLDPNMNAIGYQSQEKGVTVLERDDLGQSTDLHVNKADGKVAYIDENREIITVRAILAGEWVANVFYYNSKKAIQNPLDREEQERQSGEHPAEPPENPYAAAIPTEVTVRVVKLNPTYTVIAQKTILLTYEGQEVTMARFEVTEEGEIIPKGDELYRFVQGYDYQ